MYCLPNSQQDFLPIAFFGYYLKIVEQEHQKSSCELRGSNTCPHELQSCALPTELNSLLVVPAKTIEYITLVVPRGN